MRSAELINTNMEFVLPLIATDRLPVADEAVGKMCYGGRFAMNDQHFQAGLVIQVRMTGRDHQLMMCML